MPDSPSSLTDSATRVMQLLGERWTFLILRQSFFGVRRFNQLQRNLGIPRTVLTDRLGKLVDAGVLERSRYRENPDFYEYRLSHKGLELYPAILAFSRWGDRYLAGEEGPPLRLRHKRCGELADPKLICSNCGEDIHAREIEIELPVTGAPAPRP
jgi:DNA-binding HxlR family transcriptional regulator